jgi:hypothetical protein
VNIELDIIVMRITKIMVIKMIKYIMRIIVMMVIMMRIIKIKIKDVMKRDNKYECEYNDNNEDEKRYIRDNNEDENRVYWC